MLIAPSASLHVACIEQPVNNVFVSSGTYIVTHSRPRGVVMQWSNDLESNTGILDHESDQSGP